MKKIVISIVLISWLLPCYGVDDVATHPVAVTKPRPTEPASQKMYLDYTQTNIPSHETIEIPSSDQQKQPTVLPSISFTAESTAITVPTAGQNLNQKDAQRRIETAPIQNMPKPGNIRGTPNM